MSLRNILKIGLFPENKRISIPTYGKNVLYNGFVNTEFSNEPIPYKTNNKTQ